MSDTLIDALERSLQEEEIDRSPLHVIKAKTGEWWCGLGQSPPAIPGAPGNPCHPHYVVGTSFCANCGRPWCKECKRILDLVSA